jgi:L-threonylcarbamoyladenylate synthase
MDASVIDTAAIMRAAALIRDGQLVAVPTETVYGLAADATNPDAVLRIFAAKGRPKGHPLIVHVPDVAALATWSALDDPHKMDVAMTLAEAFWPGPLTLIVPKADWVSGAITGGRATVGLRVPRHPATLALLAALKGDGGGRAGIAAPSANRFGHVSPTTAAHVRSDLGDRVAMVLDGGPCTVGIESTIVDLSVSTPTILRLGAVTQMELERVLGEAVAIAASDSEVKAPGQLPSHYAPNAAVEVWSQAAIQRAPRLPSTARIGTGPWADIQLPSDDAGFANGLYAALRAADQPGIDTIIVETPPDGPLGSALADRLSRASAPRP